MMAGRWLPLLSPVGGSRNRTLENVSTQPAPCCSSTVRKHHRANDNPCCNRTTNISSPAYGSIHPVPCCSYTSHKPHSIHVNPCCNRTASTQANGRGFGNLGCDCAQKGRFENPCTCSLEGQRKWLDYLWNKETAEEPHYTSCKCCDVSRKLSRCSGGSCECPCINAGHKVHFFCNSTDQNSIVARIAYLRYKIRNSIKGLLINLAILVICLFDEDSPTIIHLTIAIINLLNVCYYSQNVVRLYIGLNAVLCETRPYSTRNCLWEKNPVSNLTRYYEDASKEFFCRYWQYFFILVSNLNTVRSSPVGRTETKMGMQAELTTLGETLLRTYEQERLSVKPNAEYCVPLLKRANGPITSAKQLNRYWSAYSTAIEDEKVRLSRAQLPFQPNSTCQKSNANTRTMLVSSCIEDDTYYDVAVPSVMTCLEYQYACESDAHPSPTVASGSFFEFMKIHHGEDSRSSLTWIANMKFWLSNKIKEVVQQFDLANCLLMRHEAANVRIGSSSVTDLHAAFGRNEHLSTFMPLLAFLTLTNEQSYLVWRYRMLASQPCLTQYRWDSGGDIRGNWLPETGLSDSNIVLHFFCSYMDMRLSALPYHPSSRERPFSNSYLILAETPARSMIEMAIVRQWVAPPHFNVAVKGKVYELPGGPNNLFLSLSYLIYCIKIYQRGKIGSVSLGRFGLNLLWIVGDTES